MKSFFRTLYDLLDYKGLRAFTVGLKTGCILEISTYITQRRVVPNHSVPGGAILFIEITCDLSLRRNALLQLKDFWHLEKYRRRELKPNAG